MATIHAGCAILPGGGTRPVAIKRLHPWLVREPDVVASLIDEGRVVSRIAHPNVVSLLEVVVEPHDCFLVLEYVHGEALSRLLETARERQERVPPAIASAVACDILHGLNAAHEATDERGRPLRVVHRDVSPHNILVAVDGSARLLDFGVAKAAGRMQTTHAGRIKGKPAYMSPEQLRGGLATRRSDIYAASIVLWEMLASRPLYGDAPDIRTIVERMAHPPRLPSSFASDVPAALDGIVLRGLAQESDQRFATAEDMAGEIRRATVVAGRRNVAAWVTKLAGEELASRATTLKRVERGTTAGGG
jgi:serine/threonine-protein kinase